MLFGKKVLVTGHTGFKGGWLSLWLKEMGAEVIGYSLDPYTDEDFFVKTSLADKMTDIRGNILDLENVKKFFMNMNPNLCFILQLNPLFDYPMIIQLKHSKQM